MKEKVFLVLATICILVGVGSCTYFGPQIKKYWGVRYGQVDREIFEENLSYQRGTIKNLQKLKMEYQIAKTPAHKLAIREMILSEAISFNGKLPLKLEVFITSLEK